MDTEQQHNGSTAVEHPNADLISGLREVVDWLEQHPELPHAAWASLCFGYEIKRDARERLTQLAEALGERAKEDRNFDRISLGSMFGGPRGLNVFATAKKRDLVHETPLPEPEPILKPKADVPVTAEEDEAWGAAA